jgi:hypothetical protein
MDSAAAVEGVREHRPALGEPIQGWRAQVWVAQRTDEVVALIIGNSNQDIGASIG